MYSDFWLAFKQSKVAASKQWRPFCFHGLEARAPKEQEVDVGLVIGAPLFRRADGELAAKIEERGI